MPSSDYTNAIGGGLKLKGAKDAGVDKKKKKKKAKADATESKPADAAEKEIELSGVQKTLAQEENEDDKDVVKQQESEVKEYGKTEAQRRHEERRRKRVCTYLNDMF